MNAEALKRLRAEAGLTQAELGARAGINPSIISRLEAGERVTGSVNTLRALSDALATELRLALGDVLVALTEPQA